MKYLYCITDGYVQALDTELEGYSFYSKIYPSLKSGLKFLQNSNMSEIIGFIILIDNMEGHYNDLLDLLEKINEIGDNTIVVVTLNEEGLGENIPFDIDVSNLHLFNVEYPEVVTDSFIKRDLIGTILLEKYEPYITDKSLKIKNDIQPKVVKYEPIIDNRILWLLEEVINAPDIGKCVRVDPVLERCREVDKIIYFLRSQQINRYYHVSFSKDEMFENILSDSKFNDFQKTVYRVIFKLIKKGEL